MKTIYVLFALQLVGISGAVKCVNCRFYDASNARCEEDCEGDMCALWYHEEKGSQEIKQGCISGVEGYEMGCRKNVRGAVLCLCNKTDRCNDNNRLDLISLMKAVRLPDTRCRNYIESPQTEPKSKENVCRSNFCYYSKAKIRNSNGESEMMEIASCGQEQKRVFDIDLSTVWPGPGMYPRGCYLIQIQEDSYNLGCICDQDYCNTQAAYPITAGSVRCHTSYIAENDTATDDDICRGQFCFVQRANFTNYGLQYMKGCVSVNDTKAHARLKAGYRNIMGIEQWYCADDFCNRDLITAQESVYEKRLNVTSAALRQFRYYLIAAFLISFLL